MGLPIWREAGDDAELAKPKIKPSSTADPPSLDRVRSARIRRRQSIHGLRGRARGEALDRRLSRTPRLERSLPLSRYPSNMPRSLRDGIPHISTLLETADPTVRESTVQEPSVIPRRSMDPDNNSLNDGGFNSDSSTARARLHGRQRLVELTHFMNEHLERHHGPADGPDHSAQSVIAETALQGLLTESPQPLHARLSNTPTANTAISQSQHIPVDEFIYPQVSRAERAEAPRRMRPSLVPTPASDRSQAATQDPVRQVRDRSATPVDEWETMRSTIAPDTTLPSADSSFLSAAVSQSFNRASTSTTDSSTQSTSQSSTSNHEVQDDDSASSVASDELCPDDDTFIDRSEALAYDMYYKEMETPEGRTRIAEQEVVRQRDGNRYALGAETAAVDIGFRLIAEAVDRVEIMLGSQHSEPQHDADLLRLAEISRRDRERSRRTTASNTTMALPPHETETSSEAPIAHPVTAPATNDTATATRTTRSSDMAEALLADLEGEQNMSTMRQIIERLASRDDVPEDWWLSMGLNLSRTRSLHSRSAGLNQPPLALSRTRTGRVERLRSREHRDERGSRL